MQQAHASTPFAPRPGRELHFSARLRLIAAPRNQAMQVHSTSNISGSPSDVLIVGSGPTGALMAQRMAANGLSVVVLEAGRRQAASRTGRSLVLDGDDHDALYSALRERR